MAIRATTRRLREDAIWKLWKPFKQILVQIWKAIPSEKWEHVFVISCIAVSLDPLFFYIPIIDETHKCLAMDKKMRTTALILRSLTDIPLLIHIKDQIWNSEGIKTDYPNLADSDDDSDADSNSKPGSSSGPASGATWCSLMNLSIIINCLVILPIPQVAIIVGFFGTRGSSGTRVFIQRTIINVALVLQYLPRVAQIYLSSKKFRMSRKWIKPSLNLFLYLLASHVFAAFWYFFAIQRETSCWHQACRHTPGCVATFDCSSAVGSPPLSITVLNQLCPIHSPDKTKFDFGIYLDILQSGNTGSVNFLTKLFYSLWWGLKNLSNFGTNLQTSTYMWENCFAILICISGMLLFLYLIGNMQKYMELETTKSLNAEESRLQKIKAKRVEIKAWMSSNGDSESVQSKIKEYTKIHVVKKNLKADVDVKYFLNHGIVRSRALELFLVKNAIENVPMLRKMDDIGLKKLCPYMKAEIYKENDYIAHEVHPVEMMTFIIQGEIQIVYTNTVIPNQPNFPLMKGDYHGDSIVSWVLQNYKRSYYDPLPISTGRAICRRKVEALVLNAWDLIRFTKQNLSHLNLAELEGATPDITNQIPNEEWQDDQLPVETWKRPEPGCVKLNCSVVWNPDTKLAAIGCVCRDDKGAFMAAESLGARQFMDRFFAEASSIRRAIKFCRNSKKINLQGKVGIMVESDNQDLIECLNDHNIDSNERISYQLRPVLKKIVNRSAKKPTITFGHCKRQSNAAAKCIADHAVLAPNPSSWNNVDAPDWLSSSLEQDRARLNEKPPSTTSEQNQELVGTVLDIVIK